ncbi:MAG: ATP-binding protein [Chthonomonadaceae bacterium]|nr:ATP-binding protein [Chthonomonadaceae bacterium]
MLSEQYRFQVGHGPSPAEVRSWERSLHVLSADLIQARLDDVEVLLEYRLPLTSKRADAVLCGRNPKTGADSYVVVELKQWSEAELLVETTDLCSVPGAGGTRLHPGEQVRRYCGHMSDFLGTFAGKADQIAGVAYLHNATDLAIRGLELLPEDDHGRLFTGQRRSQFLAFLNSKLSGPGADAADRLLGSAVRPSRQLLALAAEEVQEREMFRLQDEQQVAFRLVQRAVERSRRGAHKQAIVVLGGPGSGKSVIALSLLGELSREGRTVLHATGSSAFTQTLRKVAGRRAPRVKTMFRYFNQFGDLEPNELDVLICDEAHRIRETSANRYTPAKARRGTPQVDELLQAARVPVFLLDEHQVVRPGELGSLAEIRAAAARLGIDVELVELDGQYRCGGSRAYEEWVRRLLGLESGDPVPWQGDDRFEVQVADSPEGLETLLADREGTARISAGYCWPWGDPRPDGTLPEDVVIGSWRRPWNNKKDTAVGGAPGRPFWASDPAGFGQVGCVYTAQGFEYDWSGVIFGDDLVWRRDRWVAQPRASHDSAVKRAPIEEFDRAVRNTYKVLLTRGMLGSALYSTDPETQDLLMRLGRPAEVLKHRG